MNFLLDYSAFVFYENKISIFPFTLDDSRSEIDKNKNWNTIFFIIWNGRGEFFTQIYEDNIESTNFELKTGISKLKFKSELHFYFLHILL